MWAGIVIGMSIGILGVILIGVRKNETVELLGILALLLSGAVIGVTFNNIDRPSAIEVYRGNTELKITETVRDSIVVKRDTVVVWKDTE